jgi:galactosyltransferase
MRLLIAIKSCARDLQSGSHLAIRESWGRDAAQYGDLRFFIGQYPQDCALSQDEVVLNTDDSYQGLAFKTKKILEWSSFHGYDFTLLADNDTFIMPNRLQGFEHCDYSGSVARNREQSNMFWFCHGGYGYFVSRRLAESVSKTEPKITDEDRFVGQVASNNKITPREKIVGFHFPVGAYGTRYHVGTRWQEMMYRKFCLGESVEVYPESLAPAPVVVKIKPGQILVRMKGQGKRVIVSHATGRRLVFRGLGEYA